MPTESTRRGSSTRAGGLFAGLGLTLLLVGCHAHAPAGETALEPRVITHFTEHTELFVEFPPLVAGEKSTFAAHLTRLDGYRALEAGTVEVVLSGGEQPTERFRIRAPREPGIFAPTVKPRASGLRQIALRVETEGLESTHALGEIEVSASKDAARAAPAPAVAVGDIVFYKEQQWGGGFAIEPLRPAPLREAVRATGRIVPAGGRSAEIVAASAGLLRLPDPVPVLGQTVRRGQILATLVPLVGRDEDAATLRAEADRAREAARLARAEAARMRSLHAEDAIATRRLDEALAAEAVAESAWRAAQQRLARLGGDGAGIELKSPIDGELVQASMAQGAAVAEGQRLFHVVDRRELWLELAVAEADAGRLTRPDGLNLFLPGGSEPLPFEVGRNARLVGVGRAIDPHSRSLPVIFAFAGEAVAAPLQQAVQAEVFTGVRREALSVPVGAIVEDGGERVVYVMRGGESFSRVPVRTGSRDGARIEVIEGLAAGDVVVTEGALQIRLAAATPEAMGHGHAH